MSSDSFVTFVFEDPVKPSLLLGSMLAKGWSVQRFNDGSTYFVPLGAGVGDWESTNAADDIILRVCDQKLDCGEIPSISLVHGESGGSLLIRPPGIEFTLSCDVNVRGLGGYGWLDVNWYLERLLKCFDDTFPAIVSIDCFLQ